MPWSQKELEKALILLINAPADSVSAKAVLMRCWGHPLFISHQHQRRALLVRPCEDGGSEAAWQRSERAHRPAPRSRLPAPWMTSVSFSRPRLLPCLSQVPYTWCKQSPEESFQPGPPNLTPTLPVGIWDSSLERLSRPSPLNADAGAGDQRPPFHVKPTHVALAPRVGSP